MRYGIAGSPPGLDRLLLTMQRKQARLRDLRTRLAAIQDEVEVVEAEITGLETAVRCLLNDAISRAKVENGLAWSPVALLGYRVWAFSGGEFTGYRRRWEHRSLRAECSTTGNNDDVPHTAGECGQPPCGIYAAKHVAGLFEAHRGVRPESLAVGLVGLTGKVVEHERGWRAEEATVLALTFVRGGRVHSTTDPDEIELLFQGVGVSADWNEDGLEGEPDQAEVMIGYLRQMEREARQWISESPNEL